MADADRGLTPSQQNVLSTPDIMRSALQTQHPGIGRDIQGAINTLRKLQEFTGLSNGPVSADVGATVDSTNGDGDGSLEVNMEPSSAVLAVGDSFGHYQVSRLLGKGAMGAVYLAYDSKLERYVALKTPFLGNNVQAIQRFYREARAAAQLRSPYLCPIYEVGNFGAVHFYAMAFIDGQPLNRAIREGKYRECAAAARIVQKIARGLQKAHEQRIIHRDLKSENIMVDKDGEPVVMDFGLARRVDDEVQVTTPGRLLGTPAYMSPEQVEGNPDKIGPASDVYSLGVVLYEMVAGRLPFQGATLVSVLRQITGGELVPPSAYNSKLLDHLPLERICLKMMARSLDARFASMADVIAALDEYLAPPAAPVAPPSSWTRLWSWAGFGKPAAKEPQSPSPSKQHEQPSQPAASSTPAASGSAKGSAAAGVSSPAQGSSGPSTIVTIDPSAPPPPLGDRAAMTLEEDRSAMTIDQCSSTLDEDPSSKTIDGSSPSATIAND